MPTREDLKILQSQDLELKVMLTKQRIREWVTYYDESGVYVSFSGGKDSTVLLYLVRELYPDIEAVFVNTGLEYPEIQRFVKSFDNVRILYPEKTFKQVICDYGYPIISKEISQKIYEANRAEQNGYYNSAVYRQLCGTYISKNGKTNHYNVTKYKPLLDVDFKISHLCCGVMKKSPAKKFEKESGKVPFIATMTNESKLRESTWLKEGCNAFDNARPSSKPLSFWTEQDILQYIKENDIKIASVYGDITCSEGQTFFDDCGCKLCTSGCDRTGCIFCGFGVHLERGETRFQRLKQTHPKQYDFCINGGDYDNNGIWKPNKNGLGMGHVFDVINSIYGNDFICYQ